MATRQPRAPRTAAKQPNPVPAPAPAQDTPAQAPVVETPAPAPVAETTTPAPVATPAKKRHTPVEGIAPARVKHHLKLFVNGPLIGQISEIKPKLKALKDAKETINAGTFNDFSSGKKVVRDANSDEKLAAAKIVSELAPLEADLVMRLAALQKEKIRLSLETPHAFAAALEFIVTNLAKFAYAAAKKGDCKMIYSEHIHADGIEDTPVYSLVCNLPSFVEQAKKVATAKLEAANKKIVAETKARTEKEMKLAHNLKNIKQKKADTKPAPAPAAPAPEAKPAEEEAEHEESDRTNFKIYVFKLFRAAAQSEPDWESIRISTETKSYFSDLCIQFIQACSKHIVQRLSNKTVDHNAVMNVAKTFMINRLIPTESLTFENVTEADTEAVKAELKAVQEAKAAGVDRPRVKLENLPQVPAFKVVRTISYSGSGYESFEEYVNAKVKAVADAKAKAEENKKTLDDAKKALAN